MRHVFAQLFSARRKKVRVSFPDGVCLTMGEVFTVFAVGASPPTHEHLVFHAVQGRQEVLSIVEFSSKWI